MKRKDAINWKGVQANCPDGYTVTSGRTIDMLGKTQLWRIFEHNNEPHLTRLPQDLIDGLDGSLCAARVPKEWGRCLYYKMI